MLHASLASVVNALGLNITKLDFTRQEALPSSARIPDYKRGLWWLGLLLYIASQVLGSTLALEYLRAEYVAPLGSTSLIFNFVFAYLLVGTPVTRTDIGGTVIIVLGVVGVVLFGNHRQATDFDKESNLSLSLLKEIWGRGDWIAYLTVLEVTTALAFWFSSITHEVCMARVEDERGDAEGEREMGDGGRKEVLVGWRAVRGRVAKMHGRVRKTVKRQLERWSQSRPDSTIRKAAGLCWSITGGLLAGQTLVFAKSAVKLVTSAIQHSDPNEANQFTSPLSWIIVILLVVAAVSQICTQSHASMSTSADDPRIENDRVSEQKSKVLRQYTTCGFINSLVYLDELKTFVFSSHQCRPCAEALLKVQDLGVPFYLGVNWSLNCWRRTVRNICQSLRASFANVFTDLLSLSTKKAAARPRAASVLREEGAPGAEHYDDIQLSPTNPSGSSLPSDFVPKKGQGWLARIFPTSGSSGASSNNAPGELGQSDRRRQRGMAKLPEDGETDSILASEPERGAKSIEMDEVDRLGEDDDGPVFDVDDEEFGDFKEADVKTP
ncbi:magnesium transporter, partial [Phenoliferia sp. Uapishka_3]